MERRNISVEVLDKILPNLPVQIIKMLPEEPAELLPYATRVKEVQFSDNIPEDVKELMRNHLLSDEEYLKTFFYCFAVTFYQKHSVENPELAVVAAQTGSGKSNLTAKLLRDNANYIFVDSDKYKHFRYDAQQIAKEYPVLYPNLTGPDAYDHAANIYQYAIDHKYNIIKETAPSKHKSLLEIKEEEIKEKNYRVSLHVLAVSRLNSMLSVHERYELQIASGLKTAKLTPFSRHNESYDALINKVQEVENSEYGNAVFIYMRGNKEHGFEPVLIFPSANYSNATEAIEDARAIDDKKTRLELEKRYEFIAQQMNKRKAPEEQITQLRQIKNY